MPFFEDKDAVLAAEAEAVDERGTDLHGAGFVGYIVEVAVRIGVVKVDCGWGDAVLDCVCGGYG